MLTYSTLFATHDLHDYLPSMGMERERTGGMLASNKPTSQLVVIDAGH